MDQRPPVGAGAHQAHPEQLALLEVEGLPLLVEQDLVDDDIEVLRGRVIEPAADLDIVGAGGHAAGFDQRQEAGAVVPLEPVVIHVGFGVRVPADIDLAV